MATLMNVGGLLKRERSLCKQIEASVLGCRFWVFLTDPFFSCRTTCTDCLHAVLVSCGGYTTTSIRSLIDSTVATGLSEMDTSASGVFSWSSVKIGFLELASSCVTTPWDDGAATSITNILAQVARKHESDMDEKVCLAAKAALRLCGATGVPRAPAILYVSRATSANASSTQRTDTSASDIIKNIQSTRIEASAVRATAEQAEREKAEEKRRRDEQREEEKAAKRKRTSWTKDTTGENDSETEKSRELKPKAADTTEIKQHQEEKISQESVAVDRLKNDEPNEASPLDGDDNEQNKPLDSGDDFMMRGESHHAVEVQSSSKPDEKMDLQDSDEDDEFPEIVGGGPDSDDE